MLIEFYSLETGFSHLFPISWMACTFMLSSPSRSLSFPLCPSNFSSQVLLGYGGGEGEVEMIFHIQWARGMTSFPEPISLYIYIYIYFFFYLNKAFQFFEI